MNNVELANWCIKHNNMNEKQAEDCILLDPDRYNRLRDLQWDFSELCIAYFIETIPLFMEKFGTDW